MKWLLPFLLCLLVCSALFAEPQHPTTQLSIFYDEPGCTVSLQVKCDWVGIELRKDGNPFVLWGDGYLPLRLSEAQRRYIGKRDGWSCIDVLSLDNTVDVHTYVRIWNEGDR